jgi:membrane associated rhomboid family serine protease
VWLFYELPNLDSAIFQASFYPCTVDGACHGPEPWGVSWITAMFLHGGRDHILGDMLLLVVFGKNVEDAFGPLRYVIFYFAGGFAAMITQTAMTLLFGTAADIGTSQAWFRQNVHPERRIPAEIPRSTGGLMPLMSTGR